MNVWFTSDTHFGHDNIIRYCNRPFTTFEEMDEAMITRFNEVIRPGDVLYHLGDVAWSSYPLNKFFGRLNTRHVHLIYGNHDKPGRTAHPSIVWYGDIKNVHVAKQRIVLCHYSFQTWSGKGKGAYHLFGHSHGKLAGVGRSMDVGVDTHNFYPYNFDEIAARLRKVEYNVYD